MRLRAMSDESFIIYEDRTPLVELESNVVAVLEEHHLLRSDATTVQFVGIIATNEKLYGFVPLGMPRTMSSIQTVMSLLARVERQLDAQFERAGGRAELGQVGELSRMLRVVDDYVSAGFYVRPESTTELRDFGRTLWTQTASRVLPIWVESSGPIYDQQIVRVRRHTADHLLRKAQETALHEIWQRLGWWLSERVSFSGHLPYRLRNFSDDEIVSQLKGFRQTLFDERSLQLLEVLLDYFEPQTETPSSGHVIGITRFEYIWELMLRNVILDTVQLPQGELEYVPVQRTRQRFVKSLRPDVVIYDAESRLFVLDAKYYAARDEKTLPSQSDIVKQIVYALELEQRFEALEGKTLDVRNCFVFPSEKSGRGMWDLIRFTHDQEADSQVVECRYASMKEVVSLYLHQNRAPVSELFQLSE